MVLAGWKLFFRRAFAHFFAGKGGKFLPEFIVCGACHLGAFGVCGLQTIQQHINIPAGPAGIGGLGLGQPPLAVGVLLQQGGKGRGVGGLAAGGAVVNRLDCLLHFRQHHHAKV